MAQFDEVAADHARRIAPKYVPIARFVADRVLAQPLPATRDRLALGTFPDSPVEAAAARCVEAGSDDVLTTTAELEVTHRSVPGYPAYRGSFGWPPWLPEDRRHEWLPAVESEAERYVDRSDGQVRFTT